MAPQNVSQLISQNFLGDSFLTKNLGEEFSLCASGNMVFHWADYFETCETIKAQLDQNPLLSDDYQHRLRALKRLSDVPVWIRTAHKVYQETMYNLYEKYILNQWQLDPFVPLELSFISANGPFKNLAIAECFNKTTYRDFVLVYLLQDKLPRRDFRIRLKSKILFEYGPHFSEAHLVSLEQLTMSGMLFSIDSETCLKKLMGEKQIRILINASMLGLHSSMSLDDVKNQLAPYAFNLLYSSNRVDSMICTMADFSIQSSFDFALNKKIFLFIPYDKINDHSGQKIKNIQNFVSYTKKLVREHYGQNLKSKSA